MAVTTLAPVHERAAQVTPTPHPGILLVALVGPALDLLAFVQPSLDLGGAALCAAGIAAALLAGAWLRSPRTAWLGAAALAALAGLVLRISALEGAAFLALLSIIALGLGGAFAPADTEIDAALAEPAPPTHITAPDQRQVA